jgi:hypothetical protein
MNDDDRDLRELFARLRQEDRAGAPSFRAPAPREAPRWMRASRLAAAAAIVLLALVLGRPDRTRHRPSHYVVDPGAIVWRSPTDFLLVTPGRELLRTVPAVGSPDDWTPIDLRGGPSAPETTRS